VINRDRAIRLSSFVLAAMLLLGVPPLSAQTCSLAVNGYRLNSDAVDWSMRIGAGQSCTGGFRVSNVMLDSIKLVALPTSGEVTLHGPGFTYKAKADFQGQDSFVVLVSGMSNRIRGNSLIRVLVSVVNANGPSPFAPMPPTPAPTPPQRVKERSAERVGEESQAAVLSIAVREHGAKLAQSGALAAPGEATHWTGRMLVDQSTAKPFSPSAVQMILATMRPVIRRKLEL
jgi:hypothetical protein